MKNVVVKKVNNDVSKEYITDDLLNNKEYLKELRKGLKHLCANCENCRASLCLKVFDVEKQDLSKYDFITSGLQIFNQFGDIDQFLVDECDNYLEYQKRHKPTTAEEIEELRRKKESIKIAYFDTETPEEADELQMQLIRRKVLIYPVFNRK